MSGWWFAAICLGLFLLLWAYMAQKWKRQASGLAARRGNPTRDEFVVLLTDDCEPDVAAFLWGALAVYWKPGLTPHPDDDYLNDLPIDPEEQEDWVRDFCGLNGLRAADWPDWPESRDSTVRNFARWLSEGRRLMTRAAA